MRQELTCITCPIGCRLVVERPSSAMPAGDARSAAPGGDAAVAAELVVSGNRCPRGAAYAREELLAPKRTVTATCRAVARGSSRASGGSLVSGNASGVGARPSSGEGVRRIPCRTTAPFPKDRVGELLAVIYALEQPLPVASGQVLLRDALGLGIDVIATRTLGLE